MGAERERIANKEPVPAVTKLFDSDESVNAISSEIAYIRGDVDNDGAVTPMDALELAKYLADANAQYVNLWRLDVDGDGDILAMDAQDHKMILAGLREAETAQYKGADVSFDASQDAAKITTLGEDASIEIDVSSLDCSADAYKYLTLCLKTANGQALDATVTVITDTGSASADVVFVDDIMFQASSCAFDKIDGTMEKLYITFHNAADDIIYLDSYVFTATEAAAKNAEMLSLMVNDPDIRPQELSRITARTLVIAGTGDMIKTAHTRLIYENLPDAELVFIRGNHFIANRKFVEFNKEVERFLQEAGGRP